MSASLRFLWLLVGLTVAAGIASILVHHRQTEREARIMAEQATGGDADAGEAMILALGCGACHQIPGVAGAQGKVGPSLADFARRSEIAGRLPNRPDALILWLRAPQRVVPGSGMPNQGIAERQARDIAAYLYTIH